MSNEQQQEPYDRRRPAKHPSVRASRAPAARHIRTRRPAGRKYFLGIAIDKYEHWPQRRNAGRDVQAISELLLAEYGFGKEDVHLLTDGEATFDGVIGVLRKMVGLVSQHDSLLVYYAGHSHFDELTRRGFWIPVNAGSRKTEDYLPNSLIRDFLSCIPSLHTLLISDSCFSGSLFVRGYQRDEQLTADELMQVQSSWVICSGRHDETVADGSAEGHSPFAQSILDVLKNSERKHITLDFLLDQVRKQTRSNYDQLPEGGPFSNINNERGQFVFSRRQGVRKPEDELAWAKVVAMPEESLTQVQEKRSQVTLFFNTHRGSEHVTKVIQLDKQLVERQAFLSLRDTELRLYGFLRMFPYSPYVPEVRKRLEAVMKTQAVSDTIETEKRAEDSRKPSVLPAEQKPSANTVQKPFVDFMLPEMILVEGGSFDMGCTSEQQDCQDDEELVHRVTLDSYFIGKYPVTQAQWRLVMGNNPSSFTRCNRCPVEYVSWDDVQDFIRRLNELTGQNYRLPTEAEWEFAARGGNKSQGYQYAGGVNLDDVGWYTGNAEHKTHPVGQKRANELGLYDMSGNVWEWCQDWFGDYPPSAQTNPGGPSIGCYRALRGGSWLDDPQECRVASRLCCSPDDRFLILGFRLAKTP
jgi:formylglycine-generating enzyme required for sulfatase activity